MTPTRRACSTGWSKRFVSTSCQRHRAGNRTLRRLSAPFFAKGVRGDPAAARAGWALVSSVARVSAPPVCHRRRIRHSSTETGHRTFGGCHVAVGAGLAPRRGRLTERECDGVARPDISALFTTLQAEMPRRVLVSARLLYRPWVLLAAEGLVRPGGDLFPDGACRGVSARADRRRQSMDSRGDCGPQHHPRLRVHMGTRGRPHSD